ncbi:MAG: ribosomal protein S18-alanine N-acetyltransferase [Lachnospiraceae bacterium]|nr:ribosomal protein S18-alanine N-acetyltransferase [Lachnospiraceae bacterium]
MSEEQLCFRNMCSSDIPFAAAIERAVFSRPWSEEAFAQSMGQDTIFIVALKGDAIVGYCGLYCSFGEGEITNVAVIPTEHNQGIGRAMMEYLLNQAQERGITRIVLEVRISNKNAIHLYSSLGFENCGIRRQLYEMPREDGMIMVRNA